MNIITFRKSGERIAELDAGGGFIRTEQDALDLVAACMERGADRLLIDANCLSEAFFRLRTGLAGAVLQKFANYGLKAAVVAPFGAARRGKFEDFVLETNRGNQFGIFEGREEAIGWLAAE
jgi:PadR family transcriptional regulator AphA